MAGVGVGLAASHASGISLGASIAGFLVGLALMMPGHMLGATGAGDVKFMAAVGAIVGPALVVSAFLVYRPRRRGAGAGSRDPTKTVERDARGNGPVDCGARGGQEGNSVGPDIEPFRLRAGNRDRQRPRGADRMSARMCERGTPDERSES